MRPLRYLRLITCVLMVSSATSVWSQGEHARRVAAELLVIQGDTHRLQVIPENPLHTTGLQARIRGGLSGLTLLMRLANQETGSVTEDPESIVTRLNRLLNGNDMDQFSVSISNLIELFPLSIANLLIEDRTTEQLEMAEKIHIDNCAACHDHPDSAVERPAFNLFQQAQSMPPLEFTARMLVGVRGDRMTGIGNPLLDREITGLLAYYRKK